jgi:hypothetical protein
MSEIVAQRLVEHLARSGIVVMRRDPVDVRITPRSSGIGDAATRNGVQAPQIRHLDQSVDLTLFRAPQGQLGSKAKWRAGWSNSLRRGELTS